VDFTRILLKHNIDHFIRPKNNKKLNKKDDNNNTILDETKINFFNKVKTT
jgi:hypothetical protein